MDLISYEDHRMIIDDGDQTEANHNPDVAVEFPSLQEIESHVNENPLVYSQMLTNPECGDILLISAVNTDPVLIDGNSVRLNVYLRDEESAPIAELLSTSRDQLVTCDVTSVHVLDQLINQLLNGFAYCRGLPEEVLEDGQLDIKDVTLQPFNGKIVVRSRKCRFVCTIDDGKRISFDNTPTLCQDCTALCESVGAEPEFYQKSSSQQYNYIPIAEEIRFEIIEDEVPQVEDEVEDNQVKDDLKVEDEVYSSENGNEEAVLKSNEDAPSKKQNVRKRKRSKPRAGKKKRLHLECLVCHQEFLFKKDLEKHVRKNADGSCKENKDVEEESQAGGLQCDQCNKTFVKSASLNTHMESHSQVKGYLCMDCGAAFKGQSGLINHRKRIHMGLKFHKCPRCDKEFYSKKDIDEHMRIHTGDKPFQCPQCGKCFSRGAHLKRHTETVHALKDLHQVKGDIQGETETIIIELNRTTKKTKKKSYKTLKALLTKPDLSGRTNPELIPRPVLALPPSSQITVRPDLGVVASKDED